jgi:hypothetical protein
MRKREFSMPETPQGSSQSPQTEKKRNSPGTSERAQGREERANGSRQEPGQEEHPCQQGEGLGGADKNSGVCKGKW